MSFDTLPVPGHPNDRIVTCFKCGERFILHKFEAQHTTYCPMCLRDMTGARRR
jgi:formylmethanofuran dehydrogenase subunit E